MRSLTKIPQANIVAKEQVHIPQKSKGLLDFGFLPLFASFSLD